MVGQATFSNLGGVDRRCAAKKKDEFLSTMRVCATSEEEYARMAHELYLNKGQCQARVDEKGITRVYDAARNLFGPYNPDGTTRTYFAPTGGQAYFDNQKWAMP